MVFKEYSFLELLSVIIDNRGKTVPTAEEGIPLIATNCIKNENLYPAYDKVRYVAKSTYETWFRGHPKPGDMIFTCKGSPGRVCWVPDPIDFCIAQDMVGIRANQEIIYPKYLFALLRSEEAQSKILNMHVGTLIPHFKKGDFGNLYFDIPIDMDYQKKVGDAYFDFCLKIEANRQTNQTLEQIAQAIFKSWFVDFEPTRAKIAAKQIGQARQDSERSAALSAALLADDRWPEAVAAAIAEGDPERAAMAAISGKSLNELDRLSPEQQVQLLSTAALFPDALVDSELGDIPARWSAKTLDEVTSTIIDHRGKTPKKLGGDWVEEGYPAVSAKNIKDGRIARHDTIRFLNEELYARWMKVEIEKGDILLTSEAPMGEMYFITDETKYCLSQRLYALRADKENVTPSFLYLWLQTSAVQTDLAGRATGTTVVGIRQAELRKVNCLAPSLELLNTFEDNVFSMYEKLNVNELESQELSRLRDGLLPKLLSGFFDKTG